MKVKMQNLIGSIKLPKYRIPIYKVIKSSQRSQEQKMDIYRKGVHAQLIAYSLQLKLGQAAYTCMHDKTNCLQIK